MSEFCHLHCHTQYSLLDGAAKIQSLIYAGLRVGGRRARHHGPRESVRRPRVLHQGAGRWRAAHHRVRVLPHAERDGGQERPHALPPGAAGEGPDGLPQPHQAGVAGEHRRVLLQAAHRPGDAEAVQRGARRDDVLPAGRGAPDDPQEGRGRGAQGVRGLPRHLRRRLLRGGPGPQHPGAAQVQRSPAAVGGGVRRDRRGDERRALRLPGGRRGAGRAALPPDRQGPPRPEPDAVRERPVLPQERERDAGRVPPERRRGRVRERDADRQRADGDARDRGQVQAGAADGRAAHAALPDPAGARGAGRLPPRAQLRRRPHPVRRRDPRRTSASGSTSS